MKIACVVQRFGPEIAGGAEAHCRSIALRLAESHEVTVLTSCARDYISWADELPAGESSDGELRVIRFPARQRSQREFRELSEWVFTGRASIEEETRWFRLNGPEMPDLIEHLERHGDDYDRILFWSYRYYQSFFGLPCVADRAILVPTAEEDPAIRLSVLGEFFARPQGMLFLTEEEAELVGSHTRGELPPSEIIGGGIEPASDVPADLLDPLELDEDFGLYLGRIDPNKGCATLFRHFLRHLEQGGRPVQLVLAGKAAMAVPEHPMIRSLGFVSTEVREALLSRARLLFMPSPFESLSLVLLESWNHGRPALVNGGCRVLKGQMRRANGGLYYLNFPEFSAGLDLLLENPAVADRLGAQGQRYVAQTYRWPTVMEKVERLLAV